MGVESAKPPLKCGLGFRVWKNRERLQMSKIWIEVCTGDEGRAQPPPSPLRQPSLLSLLQTILTSFCLLVTFRAVVPNPDIH